jgi:NitT/TauT family transport system substrate-binding protein
MPITLQESLRGLLYAPCYAALALGAYRREGIAIGFVSAPAPAPAPTGLFDRTVDITWGGPLRVMQTYESRPDCDLVCFGEVVTRDPFLLIGRERHPDFASADLYGVRLATVSEVPTPWLCLQEDLRRDVRAADNKSARQRHGLFSIRPERLLDRSDIVRRR